MNKRLKDYLIDSIIYYIFLIILFIIVAKVIQVSPNKNQFSIYIISISIYRIIKYFVWDRRKKNPDGSIIEE